MATTREHVERLRKTAEYVEQLDDRMMEARGRLYIAMEGLKEILAWPNPTVEELQQRAIDTLRLIGREG